MSVHSARYDVTNDCWHGNMMRQSRKHFVSRFAIIQDLHACMLTGMHVALGTEGPFPIPNNVREHCFICDLPANAASLP